MNRRHVQVTRESMEKESRATSFVSVCGERCPFLPLVGVVTSALWTVCSSFPCSLPLVLQASIHCTSLLSHSLSKFISLIDNFISITSEQETGGVRVRFTSRVSLFWQQMFEIAHVYKWIVSFIHLLSD